MKRIFLFVLILIVTNTNVLHASSINQITYAYWDKPDVEIFYVTPKKIDKDTHESYFELINHYGLTKEAYEVTKIYEEFLGEPLGHKSHELLHTHYVKRKRV